MFDVWINKAQIFKENDGEVIIDAGEKTDFFIDPASDFKVGNAPIFARKADSDFTISCCITPAFLAHYDAGALMLYINETTWVKCAFENTDLGYFSVVSVVTRGVSDDANGEQISGSSIWLKMSRKDDVVGLYYSSDGINWKMVRLFKFTYKPGLVGLEAQSPLGKSCSVEFKSIEFKHQSVEDLRKGV